ncbi:hypothetical protein [Hyphomicrobium sp.]|uniref:hypothetical protein n=1 Tax=Hyphomicrobium sp. TaxID=82 RepID=UPI002E37AB09|nr:hypothetical protein [Hyphomicrobium sp.]HEX2840002.1 hypothetical protein [Hyphomicrobium sp.]
MRAVRGVLAAAIIAVGMLAAAAPSDAGWLSRILRGAGEAGGGAATKGAGKLGLGALDNAAAHVASLPKLATGTALAAHITPEGHWKFVSREGNVFTAATPEELARVGTALAPEAVPGGKLALYLSEDTVFAGRTAMKDLPKDADLHVVVGKDAYRLRQGADGNLTAEFRPNVVVALSERALFEETVYRLGRPLNRSNIRALYLETGGPTHLSSVPRFDPATKAALVDQVDPSALPAAFSGLKGQTALISGRIEGNVLTFRGASGPEQTVDITKLVQAAEHADVNLVLLHTGVAHQPGGRNWLWQKVAVSGLDEALKRATFADFLSGLGGASSELTIKAAASSQGRLLFSAVPVKSASAPLTDVVGGWLGWEHWLGEITGNVAVQAAQIYARDEARERELDARIVTGIPSVFQYTYLIALALGVLAWTVTSDWWRRIWPPEQRQGYAGRMGYWAARTVRVLAYVLLFLPLVGFPAFLWLCILQIWGVLMLPVRFVIWLRGRLAPRRA